MSYQIPAAQFEGGGAAPASGFTEILAAPGAGFRYRILQLEIMLSRLATGIADARFVHTGPGTNVNVWVTYGLAGPAVAAGPGEARRFRNFPYPGIILPVNANFGVIVDAITAATGQFIFNVLYYLDPVT